MGSKKNWGFGSRARRERETNKAKTQISSSPARQTTRAADAYAEPPTRSATDPLPRKARRKAPAGARAAAEAGKEKERKKKAGFCRSLAPLSLRKKRTHERNGLRRSPSRGRRRGRQRAGRRRAVSQIGKSWGAGRVAEREAPGAPFSKGRAALGPLRKKKNSRSPLSPERPRCRGPAGAARVRRPRPGVTGRAPHPARREARRCGQPAV